SVFSVTANAGGTVSPGVPGVGGGVGTLTVNGNVTFEHLSIFQVDLGATVGDSLRLSGAGRSVTLVRNTVGENPILRATASGLIAGGTEFRIIERVDNSGAAIGGRFEGLSGNPSSLTVNGQAFFLGYAGGGGFNDLVLQRNSGAVASDLHLEPEVISEGDTV